MIFAWGAAYKALSDEGDDDANANHACYYYTARHYLGDLIDCAPAGIDGISCLCLMSLYLLMTHKPHKCVSQSIILP